MIELDGAIGEGGGQMLRTALTLAMVTQTAFRMRNIRAGRSKPGLLRQHLTAVQAATQISGAQTQGATLGSRELSFAPSAVRAGDYEYAIGTAGSTTLVLQTLLPALWCTNGTSQLRITGGTHNPAAPPVDFLQRAWLPLVSRIGAQSSIELKRHGFFPAGGGEVCATAASSVLQPLHLDSRGAELGVRVSAVVAGVPWHVGERETARIVAAFPGAVPSVRALPQREGPGNAVSVEFAYEHVTEVFCGFGERGRSAEGVADAVVCAARAYINSGATVAQHLADQLLLPIALAGSGSFTTTAPSSHLLTNIEVIRRFLPAAFSVEPVNGSASCWRVALADS